MEITLSYQKSRFHAKVTFGNVTYSYKDESDARSHQLWNCVGWVKGNQVPQPLAEKVRREPCLGKRRPTTGPGMQGDIGSQWIQVFTKSLPVEDVFDLTEQCH